MKKKVLTSLILLLCFCALFVLSACDFILDLVFGPSNPSDSHVHTLELKTYSGSTCTGQESVTYYKCSVCGKCYLDADGNESVDESTLGQGHLYALRHTETEHYRVCALCNSEQENSRENHVCERYKYNANSHYRQCSVCLAVYDKSEHDAKLSCNICGRKADYISMCNNRYGYEQLKTLSNGQNMQKLYDKIAEKVAAVHDDSTYNCGMATIDKEQSLRAYSLTFDCLDYRLSGEETYIVVACFRNDNPLYYWVDSRAGLLIQAGENEYTRTLYLCVYDDYYLGSKRVDKNAEIYEEIDRYLSCVSQVNDSYSITLSLHDEIIENINYAFKDDGNAQDEYWAHNILGVFSNKSAVCEGYAKAFQLLLNASGVENAYVVGSSQGEGHAWNLVRLDNGKWYWYDLTWDDQPNSTRGVIYNYFCKTNEEFLRDHKVSEVKTGINYLYDLPAAATEDYKTDNLELNETFTEDGFTYKLVGANRLALIACSNSGNVSIPAFVTCNEQTYAVRELSDTALVMSAQGGMQFICGVITLAIPSTVDLIYCNSFCDSKTLINVKFADTVGWLRSGQNVETISETSLSDSVTACNLLKQTYKDNGKTFVYVWQKS